LPALAAAAGCLALSNRLPVPSAALAVGGAWLAIVGTGRFLGDWLAVFGPAPQIGYGVAALLLTYRFYRVSTK
ncbi:MAG: hypothetical protein HOW59_34880, partial [Nonomuraea sp.]|nr:hypothetical protein [Nonomuraea sp.]